MKRTAISLIIIIIAIVTIELGYICQLPNPRIHEESMDIVKVSDTPLPAKYNVEEFFQYPNYPAGCEPVSLWIILRAYQFDISLEDLITNYMPKSNSDWVNCYYGDIYTTGFAFPRAICITANNYLMEIDSPILAYDISGCDWEEIKRNLNMGLPVMVWYTINNTQPYWTNNIQENYRVYWNEHCVVVYEYQDGYVYISDPIDGYRVIEESMFKEIWEECGRYAVVIK